MANNKNNKVPSRLRETLIFNVFAAFFFLLHFHEFASRRDETHTFGGTSFIFGPCFCKVPEPAKNANLRLVHARREFSLSEMAFLLRSIVKTCVSSRRNATFRILCCLSSIWYIFGKFPETCVSPTRNAHFWWFAALGLQRCCCPRSLEGGALFS